MKRFLSLVALSLALPGCFGGTQAEPAQLHVVNVLSKELYDDAHIKGSIHVDLGDLDAHASTWDKNTPIVFYCSSYQCTASAHAAKELKDAGFTKVYAYEGGAAEWAQHGLPMEGPQESGYLKNVVTPPENTEHDIEIITADQLKDMMQSAGLI